MEKTGLCYRTGKKTTSVPLKKTAYEIKVAGICSEITVSQKFVNESPDSIEAVYVFPKDEGAVITEFSFETYGRRFRTSVEERDEAFKHYDEALKKGDGATLLDELTWDLIQISVGNLKPKQEIVFTIKWVQELQVVDAKFRLFFPLTRFPRYQRIEADPIQADMQNTGIAQSVPYSMGLTIVWENTLIRGFTSKTHQAWETPQVLKDTPNFTSMKLVESRSAFSRDLEIIGEPVTSVTNVSYAARHTNGSTIICSRFIPRMEAWPAPKNKEVVFLLDCSGSMEGEPIANAKIALELCLRSLSDSDTFSVVFFGSEYVIIREEGNKPFEYTDKNFAKAVAQIKAMKASMGGTELYHAMQALLEQGEKTGKAQEWVVLTDGGVSDPEKVIRLVASSKVRPRIFTFGIGSGASSELLKGLSRVSGGSCEMILNENHISESVLRNFARIDQPRFENITIDMAGVAFDASDTLHPIFEGDGWNCIARLTDPKSLPGEVTLSAVIESNQVSYTVPVTDLGNWNAFGCLWASKKVCFLEDAIPEYGSNQRTRMQKVNQKEAVAIALDFGIMSNQTSFIGIEERKEGDKWIEKPVYSIIPSLIAEDRETCCLPMPCFSKQGVFVTRGTVMTQFEDDVDVSYFLRKQMQDNNSIHEPAARFQKQGKKESLPLKPDKIDQPWYLQLIEMMSRKGLVNFAAMNRILSVNFSNIEAIVQDLIAKLGSSIDRDIVATIIAIKALESDEKAASVCKKAIKKARQALITAGIDLKLLEEIILEVTR